jgi:hypothetical protein
MKYALERIKFVYKTRGIRGVLLALWRRVFFVFYFYPYNIVRYTFARKFRRPRHPDFVFQGTTYRYFYSTYNFTWDNERIIEIPIIWRMVQEAQAQGKRVLEVGNVLAYYYPISHDVLDKYERGSRLINEDVLTFKAAEPYDLIVSISTMEHVGWDPPDEPDSSKLSASILNLKNALAPGGDMVITMPLGYNREMDIKLFADQMPFDKEYFLKRIDNENQWQETDKDAVRGARYNHPFHAANGLVIGVVKRS